MRSAGTKKFNLLNIPFNPVWVLLYTKKVYAANSGSSYNAYYINGIGTWGYSSSIDISPDEINIPNSEYFHITGGVDATNLELIEKLQLYATQCDSNWNPI